MLLLSVLSVVILLRYSSVESRNLDGVDIDRCEHLVYDVSNCTEWRDVVHLSTDKVSYEGAQSTIIASYYGNDTNVHYILCYHYPLQELLPQLIDSLTGNTSVSVNFSWPHHGIADLLVRIHNNSSYTDESYLGCATTNLSVAQNSDLNLSLELFDSSGTLLPPHQHHHIIGCFMFVPTVSLTNFSISTIRKVHYSYDFGDGHTLKDSTEPNITHCYNESGHYNYSVNAIAVVWEMLSFHTNLSDYIELHDPCKHLEYDVSNCTEWKDVAHLSTDKVSYEGAQSTIIASFDDNDTNVHYILCYRYPLQELRPRLIDSLTGNTSVSVNFSWPHHGIADLLVRIHNNSNYTEESYLGCATTNLSVAQNDGLRLSLDLFDNSSTLPAPHWPLFAVGCITFLPNVSLTRFNKSHIKEVYYSYDFGDGCTKKELTEPNITHCYDEPGVYEYSVNAIAVVWEMLSFHTNLSDYIELHDEVANIKMAVSGGNAVRVGTRETVTISARGSRPITVYWNVTRDWFNITQPISELGRTMDQYFQHHLTLNGSSSEEMQMTFNQTGEFAFVAVFRNDVSHKGGCFKYSVTSGPSPAVVASSTTAVVLGVLIAVVAVLILVIVAGYIRRYRNRLTETANFKFVDLSERRSYWQRAKTTAHRVADRIRRPSETQKVGLVNLLDSHGNQEDLYGSTQSGKLYKL